MDERYAVTLRAADGSPRRIQCRAHPDCAWTTDSAGARRDDDPVFVAQFAHHLVESETAQGRILGRLRRGRR